MCKVNLQHLIIYFILRQITQIKLWALNDTSLYKLQQQSPTLTSRGLSYTYI